ncbi:MAG TPA: TonB-dependent receptor [Bacteroidetes bacterium]|nr:TonB-dependent receptor [Bacteroidota bacterium]
MKTRFIVNVVLLVASTISVYSQNQRQGGGQGMNPNLTGTVKGKIIDVSANLPVEYANIALYRFIDSTLVTGGITNEEGEFSIEKIPMGKYFGEVKFIGYGATSISPFLVNPKNLDVNLGDIALNPASENLDAVVVTGQKQMLTHNLDKKVFNVDKDINAEGGTALEIMQNIPSVEVDMEGNVSLRGSQNVTILVDGRPSTYTSIDEIPASIIETVEVITNPSARYDPDGLSGIINIVLKKKRDPGYHGMVMLTAGTGDKYNGTVNFNYRQNGVNIFTNVSFRSFRMTGRTLSDRFTWSSESSSELFQEQDFRRNGSFINFRGGADFFINNRNTLTFTGGYNSRDFNIWDITETNFYSTTDEFNEEYFRRNNGIMDGAGYNLALNYKLAGKQQGQELTADAYFYAMDGNNGSNLLQWDIPTGIENFSEKSASNFLANALVVQTDFVQPVGNGGRLETGLKAMVRVQDEDYAYSVFDNSEEWVFDPLRSNTFAYNEQQYSAYAIYSNTFGEGKFSYQGGLRVEQSFTFAEQKANNYEPTKRDFLEFFPSAHIKWDINEKNSAQVAYSRRISRPHTRMLNPFIDYSDPLNLSMGNPMLNPEFTNSFEISYYYNLPKTKVNATVYQRNTTDIISRYVEVDENKVAWSTFRNIDESKSLGLEGVVTQTLTPWWRVNANASYFQTKLYSDFLDDKSSVGDGWIARATSTWNIGKNVELQVNGNYRSPTISVGGNMRFWQSGGGQGLTQEMYWFDLGARINVLNRKGTVTLRVSDVLKTMNYKSETWGTNFTSNIDRYRESRIIYVGFSYRINEYKSRREKQPNDIGMDIDME